MLSSLPMYFLSCSHLPAGIARRLGHIQREYLWDGFDGGRKLRLVKWKFVCFQVAKKKFGMHRFLILTWEEICLALPFSFFGFL